MSSQIIKEGLLIPEQAYLYNQETHINPGWGGRIWCTYISIPCSPSRLSHVWGITVCLSHNYLGGEPRCAIKVQTTVPVPVCELCVPGLQQVQTPRVCIWNQSRQFAETPQYTSSGLMFCMPLLLSAFHVPSIHFYYILLKGSICGN